ncbi:MAG: hypothetical protein ACTSYI_15610 [Promethearchaeota archaeon]
MTDIEFLRYTSLQIINPIGELSMIIYLIIEWRQFFQWNKKLVKLENFEKRVYSELGEGRE